MAFFEILSTQAMLDKKVLYSFFVHRLTWLPVATAIKEGRKTTKTLHQSLHSALRKLKNARNVSPNRLVLSELFDIENFNVLTHSVSMVKFCNWLIRM